MRTGRGSLKPNYFRLVSAEGHSELRRLGCKILKIRKV
jgi:hypothetical protein